MPGRTFSSDTTSTISASVCFELSDVCVGSGLYIHTPKTSLVFLTLGNCYWTHCCFAAVSELKIAQPVLQPVFLRIRFLKLRIKNGTFIRFSLKYLQQKCSLTVLLWPLSPVIVHLCLFVTDKSYFIAWTLWMWYVIDSSWIVYFWTISRVFRRAVCPHGGKAVMCLSFNWLKAIWFFLEKTQR